MNEQSTESGNGAERKDSPWSAYDALQIIIPVVVFFFLMFTFVCRQSVVEGASMNPTLYDGERIFISGFRYTPEYGDIVVIHKESALEESFIKRVIATEGQTVDIDFDAGVVYVDGKALDEPYTLSPTYAREQFEDLVTVPEGCVFVMGDNRNNSKDSRWAAIGCVDTRYIIGKAVLRVMPFSKFGKI